MKMNLELAILELVKMHKLRRCTITKAVHICVNIVYGIKNIDNVSDSIMHSSYLHLVCYKPNENTIILVGVTELDELYEGDEFFLKPRLKENSDVDIFTQVVEEFERNCKLDLNKMLEKTNINMGQADLKELEPTVCIFSKNRLVKFRMKGKINKIKHATVKKVNGEYVFEAKK
ncbi:hypothetical protein C0583_01565 [Candidatus Parcubacteria bacterium]|nr:MAG: hypothetical protein C0583_01565 [Candidatus Parcubacteria bacterium]